MHVFLCIARILQRRLGERALNEVYTIELLGSYIMMHSRQRVCGLTIHIIFLLLCNRKVQKCSVQISGEHSGS